MDIEEILAVSAFVVTMLILISASFSDWKSREVSDKHWIIIGSAGLTLLLLYSIYLTGPRLEYILLTAGTIMILIDVFLDKEFNQFLFYLLMALLFIVPLYSNLSEDIMKAWASIPLCYIVYVGMYIFNIIKGGADVKCLIVLSIMFSIYPQFFGLPLIAVPETAVSQIFVFSISVLFLASLLAVPAIIYFFLRNAKEGEYSKRMFSGYRMEISRAEKADVWPLEDMVSGERTIISIPEEEEISEIYTRMKEFGSEDIWVTPMIPFIILMTLSTLIITLIGNPLFLIV